MGKGGKKGKGSSSKGKGEPPGPDVDLPPGGLDIDGSVLEGGGQILRSTVAYAAILGRACRIRRIRAGRPKPGLARQHLAGIELVRDVCSGQLLGAALGSTSISLCPDGLAAGRFAK